MRSIVQFVIIALISLLLLGCAANKPSRGPASILVPTEAVWPIYFNHTWLPLFEEEVYDQPDALLYTYVLFNQNTPTLLDKGRLSKLSHLLYILTGTHDEFVEGRYAEEETNIFFIPCSQYVGGHTATSKFSAPVSRKIRDHLFKVYSGHDEYEELKKDLRGPGPYLVTSMVKLIEMTSSDPLLYIDLSRIEYQAYPKIVDVYKEYLEEARLSDVVEVNSLKKYFWAAFFGLPVLYPQIKESVIALK